MEGGGLTIVSWNLLADVYLRQAAPSHLKPQLYNKDKRYSMIKKILDDSVFDIVCLQECDDYEKHWTNTFGKLGCEKEPSKREIASVCVCNFFYSGTDLDGIVDLAKAKDCACCIERIAVNWWM